MERRVSVKLDLKKQLRHLYLPSAHEVTVVDVPEMAFILHGRHHEIYLGDPRTAKPENLKTVLRHAVLPAE